MKIGIASDHRGYQLKTALIYFLKEQYEVIDYGTESEQKVDYPDYAFSLGEAIQKGEILFGIAICGSGIGISIACNKVKGIRAAKVNSLEDVLATRKDNDANVICLSEKVDIEDAKKWVLAFLQTPFSKEMRHQVRLKKIKDYEEGNNVS